jgi:hypothetical protein
MLLKVSVGSARSERKCSSARRSSDDYLLYRISQHTMLLRITRYPRAALVQAKLSGKVWRGMSVNVSRLCPVRSWARLC